MASSKPGTKTAARKTTAARKSQGDMPKKTAGKTGGKKSASRSR